MHNVDHELHFHFPLKTSYLFIIIVLYLFLLYFSSLPRRSCCYFPFPLFLLLLFSPGKKNVPRGPDQTAERLVGRSAGDEQYRSTLAVRLPVVKSSQMYGRGRGRAAVLPPRTSRHDPAARSRRANPYLRDLITTSPRHAKPFKAGSRAGRSSRIPFKPQIF